MTRGNGIETLLMALAVAGTVQGLRWAGYDWTPREGGTAILMPGENYWSDSNVAVDAQGHLVLSIAPTSSAGGHVACAQVDGPNLGYGRYTWDVEGTVEQITEDENAVLGLFLYRNDENEIDIEYARWGQTAPEATNMDYVNQPQKPKSRGHFWSMPMGIAKQRHSLIWKSDSISWESRDITKSSVGKVVHTWSTTLAPIPKAEGALG
eukprot:m51a1_g13649 hypothetical protein (208) ;mRNA; r:117-1239